MISLIATTYNAEDGLVAWCESIARQTKQPDEVVIVDGGSEDNTLAILREYPFRVIYDPTCNTKHYPSPVARGRNRAIQEAKGDIICVTDAGCVLSLTWLETITAPFSDLNVDVVGGSYMGISTTPFGERASRFLSRGRLVVSEFSSRSIAFRKTLWAQVGGYPEESLTGEDTLFNQEILHAESVFRPDALVYWRGPQTWREFARLQYRYAYGDGFSLTRKLSYTSIAGKYAIAALLAAIGWWPAGALLIALSLRKDPAIKVLSDVSKIAGYARGLIAL